MKLQFLGTAAAERIPAMFCACDTCRRALEVGGKNIMKRAQVLINDDLLIDFSGDTYFNFINAGKTLSDVEYLLITHAHEDHFTFEDFFSRFEGVAYNVVDGEKVFEDYVPRVVAEEWADYTTKYYSPTCSTLDTREENTAVVLQDAFGDKADSIPAPTVFLAAFGDAISGPFFDWKEKGVDADGNPVYAKYISITATSSKFDENAKITNYDEIIEILGAELVKAGFVLSPANTDTTGGESGKADRIVCYMNEDITIVIENNYTKYFWIYFYQTGDWSLKK